MSKMRRSDRERSAEFAWQVVEKSPYAVLSMVDSGGSPYAVPLFIAKSGESVYFHCAKEGEKSVCLSQNAEVCLVCVGEVKLLPQEFSAAYESAILRGRAVQVLDEAEKIAALRLLSERYAAENMAEFADVVQKYLEHTAVWRVDVSEITAKQYQAV